jgi:hypothetical protein
MEHPTVDEASPRTYSLSYGLWPPSLLPLRLSHAHSNQQLFSSLSHHASACLSVLCEGQEALQWVQPAQRLFDHLPLLLLLLRLVREEPELVLVLVQPVPVHGPVEVVARERVLVAVLVLVAVAPLP